VPSWLNLDAIVPHDSQKAITRSLHVTKRELDTMREVAQGIRIWVREIEEMVFDLPSEVGDVVLKITGVTELHQLGFDIAAIFESACNGKTTDDTVLERLDEIDSEEYGKPADYAIAIIEEMQS
jgi:hypothetical protein